MTTRKINFVEGEYYHIYNRGNSKQIIFLDDQDRDRFVKLLYLCNSEKSIRFREDIVQQKIEAFDFDRGEQIVSIGAWVLMPNHFHIYVSPRPGLGVDEESNASLINFVQKLSTAYSMYFNKKYKRTGSLYEGRFKSTHVESDEQAKYNFSYIHLNPIKLINSSWKEDGVGDVKKTLDFLDSYKWSSYLDYKGVKRLEDRIISPEDFPDYFSDKKVFEEEIFDWVNYNNK
jgi:putative transposase